MPWPKLCRCSPTLNHFDWNNHPQTNNPSVKFHDSNEEEMLPLESLRQRILKYFITHPIFPRRQPRRNPSRLINKTVVVKRWNCTACICNKIHRNTWNSHNEVIILDNRKNRHTPLFTPTGPRIHSYKTKIVFWKIWFRWGQIRMSEKSSMCWL